MKFVYALPKFMFAIAITFGSAANAMDNNIQAAQITDQSNRLEVAKILVRTDHSDLIADGRSQLYFNVTVLNKAGTPIQDAFVSVAVTGGRLLDESGRPLDDGLLTVPVRKGLGGFSLIAPGTAGEVRIRVSCAKEQAEGRLEFLPENRDMVATGLVEAIVGKHTIHAGNIMPTNFNDGFEQEISHWSRQFGGDLNAAGRAAFFMKGKISSDTLLTASYDSDKDTRLKLANTIDPNAIYPIYGDESIVGYEAQSSSRLFVRLDKERNYLLLGDFSTNGTSLSTSPVTIQSATIADKVLLGRYNRTATGIRGHFDNAKIIADSFVIDDSLKQAVEEYPANGTSGPFAVQNNNATQNSERVEVIVRDKNQRDVIKSVTPLVRFVDYSFEPFSGRILLTHSLLSLTPLGDPVSLRITYELDQGGAKFLTYGISSNIALKDTLHFGISGVEDENPLSQYRLRSANADWSLTENLRVLVEAAHTDSMLYSANGQYYAIPSGQVGEVATAKSGNAKRVEVVYSDKSKSARLWWLRADDGFNNASSGVAPAKQDSGIQGTINLTEHLATYADYIKSEDLLAQVNRHAGHVGLVDKVTDRLKLDFSLSNLHDNSGIQTGNGIGSNSAPLGGGSSVTGGFFGTGTMNTVVDPLTGLPVNTLASTGNINVPTKGANLNAHTARLGATWQATDRTTIEGGVEASISGENHHRLDIGTIYSMTDNEKLYARAETQTGLASSNSLNNADRSTSFIAGLTQSLSAETSFISEYRMENAFSTAGPAVYNQMIANGLHNVHPINEGLLATSSAEYLKIFAGTQRQALALTGGLDYTANPSWKASEKLEFRRLFDDKSVTGDQAQDQWLSTVTFARKLDSSWTLLMKNYLMLQVNHDDSSGSAIGNTSQERFLTGFAWRPIENNKVNGLARYEYKSVNDQSMLLGEHYTANIFSLNMDYHPKRDWWSTGRAAYKSNKDYTLPSASQDFSAWLLSGRLTIDVTDKTDFGVMASTLQQGAGVANASAYGVEGGYCLKKNVWASLGYNWSGFYDRDLSGSDYTSQGIFIRLRAKFDEMSLTRD